MDYETIKIGDLIQHKCETWRVIGKGPDHCIVEKDGKLDKIVYMDDPISRLHDIFKGAQRA